MHIISVRATGKEHSIMFLKKLYHIQKELTTTRYITLSTLFPISVISLLARPLHATARILITGFMKVGVHVLLIAECDTDNLYD